MGNRPPPYRALQAEPLRGVREHEDVLRLCGTLAQLKTAATQERWTKKDVCGPAGVLTAACRLGQSDCVRWLYGEYGLSPGDFRRGRHFVAYLRGACRSGSLDIASWVCNIAQVVARDLRHSHQSLIGFACLGGHLHVADFVAKICGPLARPSALRERLLLLRAATRAGRVTIVRWLMQTFSLGPEDLVSGDYVLMIEAGHCGHSRMLAWLVNRADTHFMRERCLCAAVRAKAGHTIPSGWDVRAPDEIDIDLLIEHLGATPEDAGEHEICLPSGCTLRHSQAGGSRMSAHYRLAA